VKKTKSVGPNVDEDPVMESSPEKENPMESSGFGENAASGELFAEK
jgi:hypothetical protein